MQKPEPPSPRFEATVSELIDESEFSLGTSKAALVQTLKIPTQVLPEERADNARRDLRALSFVTIDGEDAKDFDDAVYVERRKEGFRLWVAISDVAHYVPEGSALDLHARTRATSVYLINRVLPMLPERLSNQMCSLLPGQERLCLVADMVLDAQGRFLETEIYPALIQSAARLTYEAVQSCFEGRPPKALRPFLPMLENARLLASRLHALRAKRGALELQLSERRLEVDAQGNPSQIRLSRQLESHRLIEAFMLRANEAVARYAERRGLPVLFRCHGAPDDKKLRFFSKAVGAMGFSMDKPNPRAFSQLLGSVRGKPEERLLEHLLLRSMSQALYVAKNEGHYGLGSSAYLHFTAPIRRYPDLWTHRILKAHWAQKRLPAEERALSELGRHCSEREHMAMRLERDVVSCGGAYVAQKHLGKSFEGTLVGFAKRGCFIELDGLWVEGLLRLKELGRAAYFDEANYCFVLPNGRNLQLGMRCVVRIHEVYARLGYVRLKCVSLPQEVSKGPKEGRKSKKFSKVAS